MAEDDDGQVIDPYGGRADLAARVLRHVSPAFAEDPLRVLRVARFAARYADSGFRIAEETLALMRQLAESGELKDLTPERAWKEISRALMEPRPDVFVQALRDCGALAELFPELDAPVPGAPEAAGPRLEVLRSAPGTRSRCRSAGPACCSIWERTRPAPRSRRSTSAASHHASARNWPCWPASTTPRGTALRSCRPRTCRRCCSISTSTGAPSASSSSSPCARWTPWVAGRQTAHYPQADYLRGAAQAVRAVQVQPLLEAGHRGAEFGEALKHARLAALETYKANRATS